jgi:hypothetical protein
VGVVGRGSNVNGAGYGRAGEARANLCDAQNRLDALDVLAHDAILPHSPISHTSPKSTAVRMGAGIQCGKNAMGIGELTEPRSSRDVVVDSKVLVRRQSVP